MAQIKGASSCHLTHEWYYDVLRGSVDLCNIGVLCG